MNRREFITMLGGAAATWPLAARAQQMASLPTVGFLGAGSPTTADVWVSAFTSRLRELGWIEGRNIKIDVRWAEGRNDRSAEIATELVRLKVDGDRHIFERAYSDCKTGDLDYPNCIRTRGRPCR